MDTDPHVRLATSIVGDVRELRRLRRSISAWLDRLGVDELTRDSMVVAAHEAAAQAIERGADEVVVEGSSQRGAVLVAIAGGDWSSLDDLRSELIRASVSEVRIHRGAVALRSHISTSAARRAKRHPRTCRQVPARAPDA